MRRALLIAAALGCLSAERAAAQDQYMYDTAGVAGPFHFNVGGQLAIPLADSAKRVDLGWGFALGVTYEPKNSPLGVQFEWGADWANLKTGRLANAGVTGTAALDYLNLNLVGRTGPHGHVSFYFIGGGGLYYRRVTVSQITGTAIAPYCDPWLLYCSTVPVATGQVLGTRSRWDWGVDAGLGVSFGVSPPVGLYVEARYHYIFGPTYHLPGGGTQAANGQYLPITIGVRF